jgi:hypothetical protein
MIAPEEAYDALEWGGRLGGHGSSLSNHIERVAPNHAITTETPRGLRAAPLGGTLFVRNDP